MACKPGIPKERFSASSSKGEGRQGGASSPATCPPPSPVSMPDALLRAFRCLHLKGRVNRTTTLETLRTWAAHGAKDAPDGTWSVYESISRSVNVRPGELESCNREPARALSLLDKPVAEEARDIDIRFFPTFRALDDGETPLLAFYYVGTEMRLAANRAFEETFRPVSSLGTAPNVAALSFFLASLAAPDDAEEMVNAMAHILFEGQGTLSKVFKFRDQQGVELVASFRLRQVALPELDARMGLVTLQPLPSSRYVIHPLLTHPSAPSVKRPKRGSSDESITSSVGGPSRDNSGQWQPKPVAPAAPSASASSPSMVTPHAFPMPLELWGLPPAGGSEAFLMPSQISRSTTGCFSAWPLSEAAPMVQPSPRLSQAAGQGQGQGQGQAGTGAASGQGSSSGPLSPTSMDVTGGRWGSGEEAGPPQLCFEEAGAPGVKGDLGEAGRLPTPPCWIERDSTHGTAAPVMAATTDPDTDPATCAEREEKALWMLAESIFTE